MKTSNKTDKQVNKNTSNTNECYNEIKEGGIIRVVDGTFSPNSVLGKTTLWRSHLNWDLKDKESVLWKSTGRAFQKQEMANTKAQMQEIGFWN